MLNHLKQRMMPRKVVYRFADVRPRSCILELAKKNRGFQTITDPIYIFEQIHVHINKSITSIKHAVA